MMIFFTIFSKDLYAQTLPKVVITKMKTKEFPVTVLLEDGSEYVTTKKENALPKDILDYMSVFVLEKTEDGYCVRNRELKLGVEENLWVEVLEGLDKNDKVVLGSDRKLEDGMKVILLEEQK